MNQEQLLARMGMLFHQCLDTAQKKNSDYAGDGDAFKNFRGCERHGISLGQGILVRMEDKIARLGNLLRKEASVKDESFVDTAKDLANYALILASWWEDDRATKVDVVARSPVSDNNRRTDSVSGTVVGLPPFGYNGQSGPECKDYPDFHPDLGC